MNQRRRLVYLTSNSTRIDAALYTAYNKKRPHFVSGSPLFAPKLSLQELLQYKAIISLEGNGISSSLKWILPSAYVVVMPRPRFTSWAVEEWLEPWVHYIPVKSDLSDVEEAVYWMLSHDGEAQQIAVRGALWMHDLVQHPEAASDDDRMQQEFCLNATELGSGRIQFVVDMRNCVTHPFHACKISASRRKQAFDEGQR